MFKIFMVFIGNVTLLGDTLEHDSSWLQGYSPAEGKRTIATSCSETVRAWSEMFIESLTFDVMCGGFLFILRSPGL